MNRRRRRSRHDAETPPLRFEEDLSSRRVTLSSSRGHGIPSLMRLYGMACAILILLGLMGLGWMWSLVGVTGLVAMLLLGRERTVLTLGPHALRIDERHAVGTTTTAVDYATITALEPTTGHGGRPLLVVHHGVAEPVVIAHGTEADHALLAGEITERLPDAPADTGLAAPEALERLRGRENPR